MMDRIEKGGQRSIAHLALASCQFAFCKFAHSIFTSSFGQKTGLASILEGEKVASAKEMRSLR
jgi:hypothetical protein